MNSASHLDLRVCVQILMYNCERFILHAIANCAPFAERIYVAWSDRPWAYNRKVRNSLHNNVNTSILEQSPFFHKIEIIKGDWEYEEEQRNDCLQKAREAGFDVMIIQDADEFLGANDYLSVLQQIKANRDVYLFRIPTVTFWKDLNYLLMSANGQAAVEYFRFAVNCKGPTRFVDKRATDTEEHYLLNGQLFHLSYVLTDEELRTKIATWGHAVDFDADLWYVKKWRRWHPGLRNLHPVRPERWHHAQRHSFNLPPEAKLAGSNISATWEQPGWWRRSVDLFDFSLDTLRRLF